MAVPLLGEGGRNHSSWTPHCTAIDGLSRKTVVSHLHKCVPKNQYLFSCLYVPHATTLEKCWTIPLNHAGFRVTACLVSVYLMSTFMLGMWGDVKHNIKQAEWHADVPMLQLSVNCIHSFIYFCRCLSDQYMAHSLVLQFSCLPQDVSVCECNPSQEAEAEHIFCQCVIWLYKSASF